MAVETNPLQELRERTAAVDAALEAEVADGSPQYLHEAARHLVQAGGKRLRPAVLLLFAEAVDPEGDEEDYLPAAVAVELVHTLSLIHDDVIDDDDLRRGTQSVHLEWDESTAIVAGDLLYARAFAKLAETPTPTDTRLECVQILAENCQGLCEGQARDMRLVGHGETTEEAYLQTVSNKTGSLFAAAAEIGALLGGADDEVATAAAEYGRTLGIAFQLHDDVLDVTGSADELGKPVGSDMEAGKTTLISVHAAQHGVEVGAERASTAGTAPHLADVEAAGSLDYVNRLTDRYLARALSELEVLPPGPARESLADIAIYAVERRR